MDQLLSWLNSPAVVATDLTMTNIQYLLTALWVGTLFLGVIFFAQKRSSLGDKEEDNGGGKTSL